MAKAISAKAVKAKATKDRMARRQIGDKMDGCPVGRTGHACKGWVRGTVECLEPLTLVDQTGHSCRVHRAVRGRGAQRVHHTLCGLGLGLGLAFGPATCMAQTHANQ